MFTVPLGGQCRLSLCRMESEETQGTIERCHLRDSGPVAAQQNSRFLMFMWGPRPHSGCVSLPLMPLGFSSVWLAYFGL